MKYLVSVEKRMYATGVVEVECESEEEAVLRVEQQINAGTLQTTAVDWSDAQYEDGTFCTTGDVD